MIIEPSPEDYTIAWDHNTGVVIVFQDIPGYGKQVVALAESETEAGQMIEELIAGTRLPLFIAAEDSNQEY